MNSFLYKEINPIINLVVVRSHPQKGLQTLLIQQTACLDVKTCKWALPSWFQNIDTIESPFDVTIRKCEKGTGLSAERLRLYIKLIGIYSGTDKYSTQSHSFFLSLDGLINLNKSNVVFGIHNNDADAVFGVNSTVQTKWVNWYNLRTLDFVFNHATIINNAERFIAEKWRYECSYQKNKL